MVAVGVIEMVGVIEIVGVTVGLEVVVWLIVGVAVTDGLSPMPSRADEVSNAFGDGEEGTYSGQMLSYPRHKQGP